MKRKPGQVVLDAIDASLDEAETMWGDSPGMEQTCRELRTWRRAFKKMAGAMVYSPDGFLLTTALSLKDEAELCKSILKARKVEGRRR